MKNIISILKERCLFEDITSPDAEKLLDSPTTIYAGFDPTSESLQAGNFVTIMTLAHFQRCGHRVIAVVGGATGMIGDPSGKSSERKLMTEEVVESNLKGIKENLSRFLNFDHPDAPAKIVNNNDWLKSFSFVDFLREVGKHFRMGPMLGKESVRTRLNSDTGMSFAEFSYQLLQAYDFLRLHDDEKCLIQIGGSDQWGNITAGIDLIHKLRGAEAFGVTTPLVCDSSGKKFGKSEGNAIYLDNNKTSYYDFYQFFFRTTDADVVRFLKIFTFLPLEEIKELEHEVQSKPEGRAAQKKLAEEVTRTVHGEHGLELAQKASSVLFGESIDGLNSDDLLDIFANVPSKDLPISLLESCPKCEQFAVESELCKSKSEARRLIKNGGFYVNNRRIKDVDASMSPEDAVDGKLTVLRSGKKNYRVVRFT